MGEAAGEESEADREEETFFHRLGDAKGQWLTSSNFTAWLIK